MTGPTLRVSNVGGIESLEHEFDGPVSVVTGPNASNKTSLLQALAFGLGHGDVRIRNGAERARVELAYDGRSVVREAERTDDGVRITGDPWLESAEDVQLLERFACLFEFSPLREAVRTDGDYETLLKEPMDVAALERERAELVAEKRDLERQIEDSDDVEERLRERRQRLSEKRDRLEAIETELDDLRERRADATAADDELDDLRTERADLAARRGECADQVETLEESIERLDERIADVDSDLEDARASLEGTDVEALEAERESIRSDLSELIDRIEVLQSVLTANREMLDSGYAGALGADHGLIEDGVTCWACGNAVPESDLAETLDDLAEVVAADKQRRESHEPRLRELDERIESAEAERRRIDDLRGQKRDLERRRNDRRESLETKRDQVASLREEIEALDERIAEREAEQSAEVTEFTDEIEDRRVALRTVRRDVDRLESKVESLESERETRERRLERKAEVTEEIGAITRRIENLEDRLREEFNDAMAELLDVLAFERVERVRLNGDFDVVVAREEDGVTRRDGVENLSESERELIGLVLALAGHLTYDVSASVPVLAVDALGAFDAERTARLIEYFADETGLLIAALLPEVAQELEPEAAGYEVLRPRALRP